VNDCNPIPCNCVDGPSGAQGLAGPKGNDGAPGVDGDQGIVGLQGEQGSQGENGINGEQGVVGDNTVGGTGPQGPQGPQGNQGIQGPDGLDGNDGTAGVDGNDVQAPSNIIYTGFCPQGDYGGQCVDCLPCGAGLSGTGPNGINHWNDVVGPGYKRVDVGTPSTLGDRGQIISFMGASGFKLRCVSAQMNSFEMTAFNSTINNKAIGSPSGPPFPEAGLKFESPNGSDCIEYVYAGDDEWIVVKSILAGGVFPTVL